MQCLYVSKPAGLFKKRDHNLKTFYGTIRSTHSRFRRHRGHFRGRNDVKRRVYDPEAGSRW